MSTMINKCPDGFKHPAIRSEWTIGITLEGKTYDKIIKRLKNKDLKYTFIVKKLYELGIRRNQPTKGNNNCRVIITPDLNG